MEVAAYIHVHTCISSTTSVHACMCTWIIKWQLQCKTLWAQVNYTLSMPLLSYIYLPLISLHPCWSINIIIYINAQIITSVLHHITWLLHTFHHICLHIQHLLLLCPDPCTREWWSVAPLPRPLHPWMVTPQLSTPSLSPRLPKCPLSPEGPQAGTHVHSLLV